MVCEVPHAGPVATPLPPRENNQIVLSRSVPAPQLSAVSPEAPAPILTVLNQPHTFGGDVELAVQRGTQTTAFF